MTKTTDPDRPLGFFRLLTIYAAAGLIAVALFLFIAVFVAGIDALWLAP